MTVDRIAIVWAQHRPAVEPAPLEFPALAERMRRERAARARARSRSMGALLLVAGLAGAAADHAAVVWGLL